MKIQMIAFDLDGTLLGPGSRISAYTVSVLERAVARGVRVTLATGRVFCSAAAFAHRLGLSGPIVTGNGGLIRDLGGATLLHRPLGPEVFPVARRLSRELEVRVMLFAGERLYVAREGDRAMGVDGCRVQHLDAFGDGMELPEKLFVESDRPERLEAAHRLVRAALGDDLSFTSSDAENLEVTQPGVDKGSGVVWLAARWGVPLERVMVVGDSQNDISMFRVAGFGVAMGNADPELKGLAAAVTESNVEDGAARAVERYVLGESGSRAGA
ncbi:MAG: Cof-type HAD-IIB family hydrolase [Bacillota bacterium]